MILESKDRESNTLKLFVLNKSSKIYIERFFKTNFVRKFF